MNNNIFIPKQINVGFQERNDTYTKKLAYVIYYDNKGVLRKETSWQNWRKKEIPNVIYDNVPTSGFVLNKKVGDYSSDWNHRQAYVRVYDSRDFEFEITIENLLYILENTSSIKGKGLEGEFVYSWDGKDLLLLPVSSPDYAELTEFNKLLFENKKIKAKELILGATYKTKSNDEWVYMGRFDYHTTKYERIELEDDKGYYGYNRNYKDVKRKVNKGKHHYFVRETINYRNEPYLDLLILKSLGDKFIDVVASDCVNNYSELFEVLEGKTQYSPYDESKDEHIEYTLEEFKDYLKDNRYSYCFCMYDGVRKRLDMSKIWDSESRSHFIDKYKVTEKSNYADILIKEVMTVEDIHNELKPSYKNEYLENGKFLQRSDY